MKSTLPIIFLTLIIPIASAQVSDSSRYNAPLDAVWRATIETVADSQFEVQSSDKASGAIWLQTMKGFGGGKGVLELMKIYTTKKGHSFMGVSNFREMRITGSVTVNETQPGTTYVTSHFSYAAYHEGGAVSNTGWEPLESNWSLEKSIFNGITNRLKINAGSQTRIVSDEFVHLTQATLEKFRRLDAAFKIDAGAEAITNQLIDAQAQFDQFVAYKSPLDISELTTQLGNCLDGFKKARTTVGQDRSNALAQSRAALSQATETLQALKSPKV